MEQVWYAFPRRSVGTRLSMYLFPRSHALRGNAYLRDEHFITSSFEEVTNSKALIKGLLSKF